MNLSILRFSAVFLVIFCLLSRVTLAAETVSDVVVEGNQRLETTTVLSYLALGPGDPMDDAAINSSVKQLYATELFADVQIVPQGSVLKVVVKENPVIHQIAFEGNESLKDDALEREIALKPRRTYTQMAVQEDVKRLQKLYQRGGRFSTQIEPKIIPLEQNRVNLVFEIKESDVTKVKKIYFIGNEAYSDGALTRVVRTEPQRWYKFFSSDDTYDPDRLMYDQELLRRHYVSNGYADFQVTSANVELSPEQDGFYVTFSVSEGPKYTFGVVDVRSALPNVNLDEIKKTITTAQSETFNAEQVEESIDALTKELGDQGYAFVAVDPLMQKNSTDKTVSVMYGIKEGPRVYVERIDIHGNVRTLDEVVRREFRLSEGDPYSATKLQRSEQRIRNLGFFEKVKISNRPGTAPDRTVIDVEVEERSTGELTFGAGFSTADGALADIGIQENNLLGTGKQLKADAMIATERQDIQLSFTEPYFMGRDLSTGFDIFKTTRDLRSESSFDKESVGGTLRSAYSLSEHLRHSLRYTYRQDEVTDVDPLASRFIRDQKGKWASSLVGHTLLYDERDNRFDPTEGYYMRLSQDVAGLGGDAKYLRNELGAGYYIPISDNDWVLRTIAKAGYLVDMGDGGVRINDRFFIGSNDIRGFNSAGIGPRDITTKDALGGNMYYVGTLELAFPLGLPDDYNIRASVFTDVGSLWDVDLSGPEVVDENSLRASAGVGISWGSPFGPIRIDFAEAFQKEEYDETELIRFSFGTRF
jgi:outer membrane protein insertion porin family